MKELFRAYLFCFIFLWVGKSQCAESYYEGLAAMSFYNLFNYYKNIDDRGAERSIAGNIAMESFTYFVNREKMLIKQSIRVEKAIFYTCSNLKEIDQSFFSDPYFHKEKTGFLFNPAAVKGDDDYHDLVKKFKIFLEKGRKEMAKTKEQNKGQVDNLIKGKKGE